MQPLTTEMEVPDEQLAQTVSRRDDSSSAWDAARDAFGQLYQRHASKLLAFLASRVRRSDIEDVNQEVWRRIWQYLPAQFQGGNFRAWLFQICRNYLIDLGRKPQIEALDEDRPIADTRQDRPDERLLEHERMLILQRCLEKLAADASSVVRARLSGDGYEEICQRTGLRPERAHKLFHTAKQQLQDCVKRASA